MLLLARQNPAAKRLYSFNTKLLMPSPQVTILYIDDDKDDRIFLESSLNDAECFANFIFAGDGEEAANYLNKLPENALPSLIVLDLNMPRWDGHRTLRYLKSQPHLASIPVAILSTSDNSKEKQACEQLGAAGYFSKPFHYDGYRSIVTGLLQLLQHPTEIIGLQLKAASLTFAFCRIQSIFDPYFSWHCLHT